MNQRIIYRYDGNDLADYNVVVKASTGVLDLPAPKERAKYDWADMNGHIVDTTSRPHYQPRQIVLSCAMFAHSANEFMEQTRSLQALLRHSGTRLLTITLPQMPAKPLVFLVYPTAAMAITKNWSAGSMTGSFDLTLEEPEPLKAVYETTARQAVLNITMQKKGDVVNVYWGDGQQTLDITATTDGATFSPSHEYAPDKHYIVVTGDIEYATIQTTATLIWNLL